MEALKYGAMAQLASLVGINNSACACFAAISGCATAFYGAAPA
jgi:hypothetical protein